MRPEAIQQHYDHQSDIDSAYKELQMYLFDTDQVPEKYYGAQSSDGALLYSSNGTDADNASYEGKLYESGLLVVSSAGNVVYSAKNCGCSLPLRTWDGRRWARMSYQDVGKDGRTLFASKDASWISTIKNLESHLAYLRDYGANFKQPSIDGWEMLCFQSDATGPFDGDSSVYVNWTQLDNPCTTSYGNTGTEDNAAVGYTEKVKVGVVNPFHGLALSSDVASLLDSSPYSLGWCGAICQNTYWNGLIPFLTNNRYAQFWIRVDNSSVTLKILTGGTTSFNGKTVTWS